MQNRVTTHQQRRPLICTLHTLIDKSNHRRRWGPRGEGVANVEEDGRHAARAVDRMLPAGQGLVTLIRQG
ncbi:hypothetical protein SKAU_G00065950 [Synaphobranchus kaupii]|uniref:Uncharacterized protein n=1 Tax=Synaphobranchus kaupii TaxID=118154 RepID=A0A9Q1G612_SYNKA|nr:hypothetical protein SKAU_G00065950 [Synaphobranchus kaupii]